MVDKITAIDDETVEAADLVASDELAKGDIVITTTIDGITYIDLADSVTGDVDSYSMKNDILTVDGVEYGQSDISNQTDYQEEISNAEKKTEYTFYLDHFGYIRIFAYPAAAEGNYLLLTDGWYNETRTADEYAVKAYLDGKIQDIDVNAKKTGNFIDESTSLNNSWGNLVDFDKYQDKNDQKSVTNIAAYTLSSDNVLSLSDVKTYNYDKKNVKTGVDVDYVDLDEVALAKGQSAYAGQYTADASDKADWAVDEGNVTVQATKNTVFYYVTLNNKGGVKSVKTVVGYKNSVAVTADNINAAYAVATNTGKDASGENYWVADVIVVEINKDTVSYEDVFFNAYAALKTVKDTVNSDAILATGKTGELVLDISDNYNEYKDADGYKVPLWFYQKTEADADGVVVPDKIVEDYADYGIYTATADRVYGLMTYLTTTDGTALEYSSDDVTVYALTASKSDKYGDPITSAVTEVNDKTVTVKAGDDLIVFCDGKKLTNVVYVINVTKSVDASKLDTGIKDLYNAIMTEATAPTSYEAAVKKAENALNANPQVKADLEAAKTALNALNPKNLTATELLKVQELVEDIDDALAQIADDTALQAAKNQAIANLEAAIKTAVQNADTNNIISDYDAVLIDETTSIAAAGWGTGYETVAKALATWTGEINGVNSTTDPKLTAVINANHPATLATAYVNAVAAEQQTAGHKANANNRATTYLEAIKTYLANNAITWTAGNGDTVKSLVESEISTNVTPATNSTEYTVTVTAPTDVSFVGNTGTKTVTVNVSVTNSYAGVVSDAQSADIVVTFSW